MRAVPVISSGVTTLPKPVNQMSLSSRGTVLHFAVSIILVLLLPVMVVWYFFAQGVFEIESVHWWGKLALAFVLFGIILGLIMLSRYPVVIVKLKRELRRMANNDFFNEISLFNGDADVLSIDGCLRAIMEKCRSRIMIIQKQQSELLDAERQRVMIESLAAACHHLGQPATVITSGLALLEKDPLTPDQQKNIVTCKEAASKLRDVLHRLQAVHAYRTVPYWEGDELNSEESVRMVDIDPVTPS